MAAKKKASAATTATAEKKAPTKAEILNHIASETELNRKEVAAVLDSLTGLIEKNLKARGPGYFTLPGLLKIKVVKKPARKAREAINPFTKEMTTFAAKPAHKSVKIQALKALKDMV